MFAQCSFLCPDKETNQRKQPLLHSPRPSNACTLAISKLANLGLLKQSHRFQSPARRGTKAHFKGGMGAYPFKCFYPIKKANATTIFTPPKI